MQVFNKLFIYIIKFYQLAISPILSNNCRYQPTCSNYVIDCLKKHNLLYAIYLGTKRILTCHPFGGSGYDPVP